ncbi:MAG: hypothetical protein ACFNX7_01790, partial [Capnocytophaga gingivalis]
MKKIAFILLITASSFASAQVIDTLKTNVSNEQAINEMKTNLEAQKEALEAKEFAIKQEAANRKLAERELKLKERQ